jgi:transcriptional regulator with XRE-family HTH domain
MARMDSGLSQEKAASKLGVHVTTLNKYENGHRHPSGKVMLKMVELYKCTMDELLDMKSKTPNQENRDNILNPEENMYRQKFEEAQAKIIQLLERNAELEKLVAGSRPPRKKKTGNGV